MARVPLILLSISILLAEIFLSLATTIPTFITEPADTNVVRNFNAEMHCMATGLPVPKVVSWMKDGAHVIFDGTKSILPSGTLRISNARVTDAGWYQCVAQNYVGSVISKRAKLTVAYFDILYISTENKLQAAGSSLVLLLPTLQCQPKPKYTWKKDGISITEDKRISVSKEGTLYIADLKGTDFGTYSCEAENTVMSQAGKPNAKQIVKRVLLTLGAALKPYPGPSLIRGPKDTTALQGVDVVISLECFPNRSDTTIVWKKNGAFLYANQKYRLDTTRKRLTINGPIRNDEGQYSCEATYLSQRATGSGTLRVIVPPKYITQKTVVNAQSDNSTILWCNATAYPSFSSTWYHNSRRIYSSNAKYQLRPDRGLHISKLTWADGGVYQCVSQNNAGQLIGTIRLNVLNKTAIIEQGPLPEQYFHVGATAVVPCVATGAPKPTIKWLRNNQAIPAALTRISVTSKGSLRIINAQKSDSATFTCIAKNGAGDFRKIGYVGIVDPTIVTKGPNKTTIAARSVTVILPCEVSHDPTVNVTRDWRKNTVKLTDPRYSVLLDGSLQILSTQQKDAATFACNVYSNGGNASVSTVLKIVSLPLSPSTPVATEIATYSLRLTWFAPEYDGGIPLTNYELHLKNKTTNKFMFLMYTKLTSVVISNLQAGMEYSFRVAGRNNIGRGWWSGESAWIPMKILAPSQPPTNLHTVSSQQTKITLKWTAPPLKSHNGVLKGYNVYYRGRGYINSAFNKKVAPPGPIGATTITYVLDNLLYFTRYEIKVAAFNDAGVGLESSIIFTETKPGVPSKGPTDVAINVVNSTAIEVNYKSPAQIYWNGELIYSRGYAYEPGKPLDAKAYDAPYNRATRYNQSFILDGLKASLHYALRVAVVTASGPSPKSDAVFFRMHEGSPGSPRNFMVTGTFAHAITLRWDRPYQTNGVLLGYQVGHRIYGMITPYIDRPEREPAYSNGAIYKGLQLNTRYEFYVLAYTKAGKGKRVYVDAQTRKTAPTLPGKPTKPMLVENNGTSITLNWLMGNIGGTLITYYLIHSNNQSNFYQLPVEQREWTLVVNLTRTQDIPARIRNLTTNTVYRFRVTPFNVVGRGPTSNVSEDITTAESVPQAAPTRLRVSAKARQELSIDWVPPPKYSWGSASISYKIVLISVGRKNKDSIIRNHPDSQLTSYIARGLAKWTYYNVSVTVYNAVGEGPPGMWVLARTAEDVPDGGPEKIFATAISSSVVNVTWTPVPLNLRNGRILGYKVFYNIKSMPSVVFTKQVSDEKTRTTLLTGLAGYETYQIRMLAYTKSGDGGKSAFVEVITPEGIAGKPYQVRFPIVRLDFVTVKWLPPLHPNGAIERYEVAYKFQGTTDNWKDVIQPRYGPNVLTADVQGLAGNRYYLFRVYARTKKGRGTPAEEIVKTTPIRQVPESPVMLPIPLSDIETRAVIVRWVAPYDGESPIRSYSLQFNRQPDGWVMYRSNVTNRVDIEAHLRQLKVLQLLPASSYSFRIKATNDLGDSAWSKATDPIMTHPSAPSGAPTNIRITPVSATSLRVEWRAPSYEALNGLPVYFLLNYKKQGAATYERRLTLPKTPLSKQIDNLEVYTVYEIAMAAKNKNGTGPWTKRTGITGESRPTGAPSNIRLSAEGPTAIKVQWMKPPFYTIRGNLLGYKIEYQRIGNNRRRKRRAVSICPAPDYKVQTKTVGPYIEEAMIRNKVATFAKYRISVRAYNKAGDGPKSYTVDVTTPEGAPSAPIIKWSKSYKTAIDVQWSPPCFSNGYITGYEIDYALTGSSNIKTIRLPGYATTVRIQNLLSSRKYKIQIKAGTRSGYGEFATIYISTNNAEQGLPGKPGRPVILHVESTAMVLEWKEGITGNMPIIKYNIQYVKSSETSWKTGWVVNHDRWIRNDSRIQYKVTDLTPETRYSFKVIAENAFGASEPSDVTSSVLTGGRIASKPFHAELWFIILLIVVAILIIALLVLFICVKRRSKKTNYDHTGPTRLTKQQQLQQQSRDLKQYLSSDVKETILCAYGESEDSDATKAKPRSKPEQRQEPKHKLEKLDLQPLAFAVPKVPEEMDTFKRRAPEGQDSTGMLRKRSSRESPVKESRFSYGSPAHDLSSDERVKKKDSDDERDDRRLHLSREKRESQSPRKKNPSASTRNEDSYPYPREYGERKGRNSRGNSKERLNSRGNSEERLQSRGNSEERLHYHGNSEERRQPRGNSEERLQYRGNSEERLQSRGNRRDYRESNRNKEEYRHTRSRSRERPKSYHEGPIEDDMVPRGSRRSQHLGSFDPPMDEREVSPRNRFQRTKSLYSNRDQYDDDVFVRSANDHRVSSRSLNDQTRFRDDHRNPKRVNERSHSGYDDDNGDLRNQEPTGPWEISFDDDVDNMNGFSRGPASSEKHGPDGYGKDERFDRDEDDERDLNYKMLLNDLTRGRESRSRLQDEKPRNDRQTRTRDRDSVKTSEAASNNKQGLSSFEMAMVRNRGGSAQRLINTDSDADARSVASKTSKKSRGLHEKKIIKAIDEASQSSSISKHSDVSDNDADKSGNETEEDHKFTRGKAAEASIASHYANDPFYRNWRSSLDKKTRKAILAEYHDKNKKNSAAAGSFDSLGSKPYRSASEEGLDRIDRRRVRPGRYDLSEKKKLAQSDPYLNQEPEPSISSFTPKVTDQPRSRRPGKRGIDRAAARSEPSLNVQDSESDSDSRFPPPYEGEREDDRAVRRKNSFLRATEAEEPSVRRGSREELDRTPVKAKKKMAAELDRAVGYYTRPPPPYEDNGDYDSEAKSPPAYTPAQDNFSSDDSRSYVGYNRGPRNWRPQRQQDRSVTSPHVMEQRRVPNRQSDEFDGPSNTSMTLV